MSNATQSLNQVDSSVSASVETPVTPVSITPEAEASAFFERVETLMGEGSELGTLALNAIVDRLGKSANKHGRPSSLAFLAYMVAMENRNLSMNARIGLAQRANGKTFVSLGHKPVFRVKSMANGGEGSLSYKLNMPVTFETTVS